MHNSALDMLETLKTEEYEFHEALSEINQIRFLSNITPEMIYTKELLLNETPEVIAQKEYGDSSYWDIIVLLNGTSMDIFPKDITFIYNETDRLVKKLENPAIDDTKRDENYQKIFNNLNAINNKKRQVKLIKKEYIDKVLRAWRKND